MVKEAIIMRIEICTTEKLKDLQYICRKTFRETFEDQNSEEDMAKYLDEAYSDGVLTEELENSDSITFIAYDNDVPVGYLKLNKGSAQTEKGFDDSLELQRIYIAKSAKEKGMGSEFIKLAEKQARDWKLSYIWLGVWEKNYHAQKFYENKGFRVFSEHIFTLGNDPQRDLLMKKEL